MNRAPLLAISVCALALGGCGFHPLYGSGATAGALQGKFSQISVEPVYDMGVANTGYDLRNALIDSLGATTGGAAYTLNAKLTVTTQGVALQNDASITRYNDTLSVTYTLTDTASGKVVTNGTETGLSSYNVVSSPYAGLVAQQDADRRVAQDIAERIRIDLGVYFDQHRTASR